MEPHKARIDLLSLLAALIALVAIMRLGLLSALLGGMLIYQLVDYGSRSLERFGILAQRRGRLVLLLVVALFVLASLGLSLSLFASRLSGGPESFAALLQRMADVVHAGRSYMPLWVQDYLPENIEEWQAMASEWLRENARHLSLIGREAGVVMFHLILGMAIGGMVALHPASTVQPGPLAQALLQRVRLLHNAFRRIVFSQIRISALNTFLTAIFLGIVLPLMHGQLPLTKTMIAVTFLAGLLPIIGNLISNTVIVLVALSVSPVAAVWSLVFLVIIHKLEYFVNARIIGSQIQARAWEILLAMLVMETAFGIPGLVAAPIFYAYLKDELVKRQLI